MAGVSERYQSSGKNHGERYQSHDSCPTHRQQNAMRSTVQLPVYGFWHFCSAVGTVFRTDQAGELSQKGSLTQHIARPRTPPGRCSSTALDSWDLQRIVFELLDSCRETSIFCVLLFPIGAMPTFSLHVLSASHDLTMRCHSLEKSSLLSKSVTAEGPAANGPHASLQSSCSRPQVTRHR